MVMLVPGAPLNATKSNTPNGKVRPAGGATGGDFGWPSSAMNPAVCRGPLPAGANSHGPAAVAVAAPAPVSPLEVVVVPAGVSVWSIRA